MCYDTSHMKIIGALLSGWDAEYAVWKVDGKAGSKSVARLELDFWHAVQIEMSVLVGKGSGGQPDPTGLLGQLRNSQQHMEFIVQQKINEAEQRCLVAG
jgi:hypothetical protein